MFERKQPEDRTLRRHQNSNEDQRKQRWNDDQDQRSFSEFDERFSPDFDDDKDEQSSRFDRRSPASSRDYGSHRSERRMDDSSERRFSGGYNRGDEYRPSMSSPSRAYERDERARSSRDDERRYRAGDSDAERWSSERDPDRWNSSFSHTHDWGTAPSYGQSGYNQGMGSQSSRGQNFDRSSYQRNTGYRSQMENDPSQSMGRSSQQASMSQHAGRGPKGYTRSDDRIKEEVCDELTRNPEVDASEIEVKVQGGEVTLTGSVSNRQEKRLAEDLSDHIYGVKEVHNQLRVQTGAQHQSHSGSGSSQQGHMGQSMMGSSKLPTAADGNHTDTPASKGPQL